MTANDTFQNDSFSKPVTKIPNSIYLTQEWLKNKTKWRIQFMTRT